MRNLGRAVIAAALLLSTPSWAQDDLEARRAAAHALVDGPLAANLAQMAPSLRAQLNFPEADPAELAAMHRAFDEGLPGMTREAQGIAANAIADKWPLEALQNPERLSEAEFEALGSELEPTMRLVGERFAIRTLRIGCTIDDQPSAFCTTLLDELRTVDAGQ
jgi:hypothetical protein